MTDGLRGCRAAVVLRATLTLGLAVASIGASAPAAALAEQADVPVQALWDQGVFLIEATPSSPAAAICLVDTGVTDNWDTGAVVARLALDGDSEDESPTMHGTLMSMFIAAPRNGHGMVGAWPAARIVSVRASTPDADSFTTAAYVNGIKRCHAIADFYDIKVIELALAASTPVGGEEATALEDAVQSARADGLSVVAAAGNSSGGAVGSPANVPGVLSVGASDASGSLCALSAAGATLRAPGCGLDAADPRTGAPVTGAQGTSPASALVAATLAALRTYRPDLTPQAADAQVLSTATVVDSGRVLNIAGAFRAAGLTALVDAAEDPPAAPALDTGQPRSTTSPAPRDRHPARLPRPQLAVHVRPSHGGRLLRIEARNRPSRAVLRIRIYARPTGEFAGEFARCVAHRSRQSSQIRVHVRSWVRVTARYVDPEHARSPSPITTALAANISKRR
jgi:hypothetical protein